MAEIEIDIKSEDDGGEVWLEVIGGAVTNHEGTPGLFTILDSGAADLLEDILRARRRGNYQFGPLDEEE